jgi:hypothetical protein
MRFAVIGLGILVLISGGDWIGDFGFNINRAGGLFLV